MEGADPTSENSHPEPRAETEAGPASDRPAQATPASPATPPASGDAALRLEHFTVLTRADGSAWELGRGAMGITYKALDARLRSHVALKVIKANLLANYPVARERFLREARAAARLRHPNIASVFHLGETASGEMFYAMEFIDGETLAARIRRDGPLPALFVVEIGIEVARALVAAREQGLVHRDLKPANLMLVAAGSSGWPNDPGGAGASGDARVKVIDFGLAKAAADTGPLTKVGDFLGTPQYASPEQFTSGSSGQADSRSDIYSLGATLWHALTGKLPFPGNSLAEVRACRLSAELPVAQLAEAHVPAPVAELLVSMLAADPDQRPQTPHVLLEALRHCRAQIDASPVPVVAAVPWPRARARSRRHMAVMFALVTILLLAVTFAGGWLLRSWRRPLPPVAPAPAPVAVALPEKSIAVLPFANLSTEKENEFFAEGVQDEILTDLTKVADLKVISRTSVLQYKSEAPRNVREIATQLGVANVLEGSVQRVGNKVRINAQLINAHTDSPLWAERYDRDLSDIFALQSEIARTIAGQLQARLSPAEKAAIDAPLTSDLPAYDLYLRARTLYDTGTAGPSGRENGTHAVELLEAAIARDPKFVIAWCLAARVHATFYFQGVDHTPARLELAHAAAEAALRIQPDAGEPHVALADYYYGFRDYEHALAELDIARRTLPNRPEIYEYSGYIDRRQGRWSDATRNLEHALELDPRSFYKLVQLAITYQDLHRFDDEARSLDRALAIRPGDSYTRILRAVVDLDSRADVRAFQKTLAALLREDPDCGPDVDDPSTALCERTREAAERSLAHYPREGAANNGVLTPHAYWEGVVARWEGDGARARAAFLAARTEVEKVVSAQPDLAAAVGLLGVIDAGLGRKEEAIAEGRRACALLPISKDGVDGPVVADNLAQIYAWTGEMTAAIEQLELIERTPNTDTYGYLKLHPIYDDLRGDRRFEALVASLAPVK